MDEKIIGYSYDNAVRAHAFGCVQQNYNLGGPDLRHAAPELIGGSTALQTRYEFYVKLRIERKSRELQVILMSP